MSLSPAQAALREAAALERAAIARDVRHDYDDPRVVPAADPAAVEELLSVLEEYDGRARRNRREADQQREASRRRAQFTVAS